VARGNVASHADYCKVFHGYLETNLSYLETNLKQI
jgi:hypothetical protein